MCDILDRVAEWNTELLTPKELRNLYCLNNEKKKFIKSIIIRYRNNIFKEKCPICDKYVSYIRKRNWLRKLKKNMKYYLLSEIPICKSCNDINIYGYVNYDFGKVYEPYDKKYIGILNGKPFYKSLRAAINSGGRLHLKRPSIKKIFGDYCVNTKNDWYIWY